MSEKSAKKIRTADLALCALFVALSAVFSWISIPVGPVPINLALIAVFTAGGLLGTLWGTISELTFVLLGLTGLPVFAGFTGGPGRLAGPTGGYILAYIICAFVVGFICEKFGRKIIALIPAMILGLALCYLFGSAWFMISSKANLAATLSTCVLPFVPGDALKIALSVILVNRLEPVLEKARRSGR
ncbi:MAG: biotin transporter BioY [Oscillospiraceae bacterium]|jgi:biotin transport system substrate-specific component|nr:biotin transporter BioY [Oscillospiraceae bacterium]